MTSKIFKSVHDFLDEFDEAASSREPIKEADLAAFEASQNVTLPKSYRDHCLKYGSRTLSSTDIFGFKTKAIFLNGKSKRVDVGAISGPSSMIECYERYMNPIYNNSGPRLPEKHFPFTFDSGCGHCLMDLTDEGGGKIRYIVIKAQTFGAKTYGQNQVGAVADSFPEFLAGLKPDYL